MTKNKTTKNKDKLPNLDFGNNLNALNNQNNMHNLTENTSIQNINLNAGQIDDQSMSGHQNTENYNSTNNVNENYNSTNNVQDSANQDRHNLDRQDTTSNSDNFSKMSDNGKSSKTFNEEYPDKIASFRIGVIGIGGAGGNAVNTMIKDLETFESVKFIVANTDHQVLKYFPQNIVIQLGPNCTRGLGAGADPNIGRKAAEESEEDIRSALKGVDMVFIASGMGGGTGTGAAPFVADIAKKMGILTVAVVTIPFSFEGMRRNATAQKGITELKEKADCVVVVPNDKLLNIINNRTPLSDAFKMADDILYNAVKCVVELIMKPGLINLDFADIRTVMSNMRTAFLSIGKASGEERALRAAEIAINNPLSNVSLKGATSLLINISGGNDLTLHEINVAVARILEERGDNTMDANILVGATFNEKMVEGEISVYTIATGIHDESDTSKNDHKSPLSKLKSFGENLLSATNDSSLPNTSNKNSGLHPDSIKEKLNKDIKLEEDKLFDSNKSFTNKSSIVQNEEVKTFNNDEMYQNRTKYNNPTSNTKFGNQQFNNQTGPGNQINQSGIGNQAMPFNNSVNYNKNTDFIPTHEFQNYEDSEAQQRNNKSREELNQVQDKPSFLRYRNNLKGNE